jgi:RimJ/RimL family protein N-acetyltransferase
MALTFEPMGEGAAREILGWTYTPPYDIYNITADDQEAALEFFCNADNRYYALHDARGSLVAFCCFGHDAQVPGGSYAGGALDIGLGLRPDLTGRGLGRSFVAAVIEFAQATFAPQQLRVTIAIFNARALRVWRSAGFLPILTFTAPGGRQFAILTRRSDSDRP